MTYTGRCRWAAAFFCVLSSNALTFLCTLKALSSIGFPFLCIVKVLSSNTLAFLCTLKALSSIGLPFLCIVKVLSNNALTFLCTLKALSSIGFPFLYLVSGARKQLFINFSFAKLDPTFVAWVSIDDWVFTIVRNVFNPDGICFLF